MSARCCRARTPSRTFRFGTGGSRRRTSAVRPSHTTVRSRMAWWRLLPEELLERARDPFPAVKRRFVAQDLGVELGVRHDLKRRVEADVLVMAHEHGSGAAMLRDGDLVVASNDRVDQAAELCLRH